MGFRDLDKYTKLVILIIVIGAIIRFALAIYAVPSGDGCWHLAIVRFVAQNNKLPLFEGLGREAFSYPPLFYILGALLYKIGMLGSKELAEILPKLISPTAGVLMLILTFKLAKRFFDSRVAFYSILFLTFLPLHIFSSYIPYLDVPFAFFLILSVYWFLGKRYFLGTISFACMSLIKFYGVFFVPLIILIIYYQSRKQLLSTIKRTSLSGILYLLILSPVFYRNYKLLHNPIWPFLNFIFQGFESQYAFYSGSAAIKNLINYKLFPKLYIGLFGLPNDDINTFNYLNLPYVEIIVLIWIVGVTLYLFPVLLGIFKMKLFSKKTVLLYVWIICNFVFITLLLFNVNDIVSRHMIPALPAIAIFWGYGFSKLFKNNYLNRIKIIYTLILVLIIFGFVGGEFVKTNLARNLWESYHADFEWIKLNTPEDSFFLHNGQCLAHYIERETILSTDNIPNSRELYLWVQDDFHISSKRILSEFNIPLESISKQKELVYKNPETSINIFWLYD